MRSRLWVLYAMTAAYAASVVAFYVFARYRYPLVPLLILFAAAGVVEGRAFFGGSEGSRPATGTAWLLGAVAGAAVFCNWPILSKTLMRAVTETNLGVALQAAGRLDEATDRYHRAIALAPDYAPAYNNLATALRAKGQFADAVTTYEQALLLRPEYPEAHYNLANALMDAGKPADAIDHFRIALQSIPASADVHNNLGIALIGPSQSRRRARVGAAVRRGDPALPARRAARSGRRLSPLRFGQPARRDGSPRRGDRRVQGRAESRPDIGRRAQ